MLCKTYAKYELIFGKKTLFKSKSLSITLNINQKGKRKYSRMKKFTKEIKYFWTFKKLVLSKLFIDFKVNLIEIGPKLR